MSDIEDLQAVADGHDFAAALREATAARKDTGGWSRTLREAARGLRHLRALGLVEPIPGTGTRYRLTRRGRRALREGRIPLHS